MLAVQSLYYTVGRREKLSFIIFNTDRIDQVDVICSELLV